LSLHILIIRMHVHIVTFVLPHLHTCNMLSLYVVFILCNIIICHTYYTCYKDYHQLLQVGCHDKMYADTQHIFIMLIYYSQQ